MFYIICRLALKMSRRMLQRQIVCNKPILFSPATQVFVVKVKCQPYSSAHPVKSFFTLWAFLLPWQHSGAMAHMQQAMYDQLIVLSPT